MENHKSLGFTLLFALFLGFLPVLMFLSKYGFYPSIPIEIMDDTLYYLGRIREVLAGDYFIGNSYLLEHVKDTTTAFFVADWIYSLPFFVLKIFSLPLYIGIIFSEVFWTVVAALLLFTLYKNIGLEEKFRPIIVTFSLLTVLFFILRPVAMSVVYPAFLFFLISFLRWTKNPSSKKENILLVLSASLSFYVYTYLWQFVLVVLGLTFLFNLYRRNFVKETFIAILFTFVLSIPVFLYTWRQINSDFYFDTLARVGLINTHTFGVVAVMYSFLLCVVLFTLCLFKKREVILSSQYIFFVLISSSLFIVGLSNVISGKDLEVAVHIGRFTDLFISIFVVYSFWVIYQNRQKLGKIIFLPVMVLFLYSVFGVYSTYRIASSSLPAQNKEVYMEAIKAINELPKGSVVLLNDEIGSYVPFLTQDYVLFHPNAELYLASDYEIEERYLISRVFSGLSKEELKVDFRKYAGVGNAVHKANIVNRKVKVCLLLNKVFSGMDCVFVDSYSLKGEGYFDNLMERYKVIKKNPKKFLDMYHVNYILLDKDKDKWIIDLKNKLIIFEDDRFILYKIKN